MKDSHIHSRQAGDVEITSQMTEAGLDALYQYETDEVMANATSVVKTILSSMLLAYVQPRS